MTADINLIPIVNEIVKMIVGVKSMMNMMYTLVTIVLIIMTVLTMTMLITMILLTTETTQLNEMTMLTALVAGTVYLSYIDETGGSRNARSKNMRANRFMSFTDIYNSTREVAYARQPAHLALISKASH